MIAEGGIVVIMKALIIEVTLKVAVLALKRKEALYRFNIGKILICRGNNAPLRTAFNSRFNILEQQNKTSLLDKANRKCKRLASA